MNGEVLGDWYGIVGLVAYAVVFVVLVVVVFFTGSHRG